MNNLSLFSINGSGPDIYFTLKCWSKKYGLTDLYARQENLVSNNSGKPCHFLRREYQLLNLGYYLDARKYEQNFSFPFFKKHPMKTEFPDILVQVVEGGGA